MFSQSATDKAGQNGLATCQASIKHYGDNTWLPNLGIKAMNSSQDTDSELALVVTNLILSLTLRVGSSKHNGSVHSCHQGGMSSNLPLSL